jgi:putative spermidine/putrescine transport system ATP-binding protein
LAYAELENIVVSYDGKTKVLKDLNLSLEKGELVSLLGSSGCGKTTCLRVMAGFIDPQGGRFRVNNNDMTHVPVHKRNFGLVFQSYALFPHLSVRDNVAFGLKLRKTPQADIKKRVTAMLEVTDLMEFADRFPKQLSGGQRQRVALARALVIEPELLLLDEPLSNLDAKLRLLMRVEIKRLQQKLGITTLFVTHDQEECFSISDRVAVMNQGIIEQFDRPEVIYTKPANEFVARFVGFTNFLPSSDGLVAIRPDDITLSGTEPPAGGVLPCTVEVRTFLGKSYQYRLDSPDGPLVVNADRDAVFAVGERVFATLNSAKLVHV